MDVAGEGDRELAGPTDRGGGARRDPRAARAGLRASWCRPAARGLVGGAELSGALPELVQAASNVTPASSAAICGRGPEITALAFQASRSIVAPTRRGAPVVRQRQPVSARRRARPDRPGRGRDGGVRRAARRRGRAHRPHGAVVVRDADGVLRDLAWVPTRTPRSSRSPPQSPDGLASCGTPPRTSWRRPCRSCSPRPSSASARRSRTASTTTSTSRSPFTPEDLKAIEKKMQEIQKRGQRFSRRVVDRRGRPRGAGRRAVQAGADRPQGLGRPATTARRRGRRRRADHLRQPRRQDRRAVLEGPLPRSAPADHPVHPGVQADAQRRRVLARQREEPAAPAHLRHRLAHQGRAEGAPGAPRRGRAKRDHRKLGTELDLFSFPDEIGSGLPVFHPKGGIIRRVMEDYSRAAARGGGLRVRLHPARHQGPTSSRCPATWTGTPTACTRPCSSSGVGGRHVRKPAWTTTSSR